MSRKWGYKYNQNTIIVKNTINSETLSVNGELQDKKTGIAFRSELTGKLPSREEIKVVLGGNLTIQCSLFVDNKLLMPEQN